MPMKTLLAGALLWAAIVPAAQAVILSATGNALDNGLILIDPPDQNEVNVVKVFTALNDPAAMLLTLEVDAPGFYAITETIANVSGVDWTGFTWLMSNAEGVFFFDFLDPPGTGPFATSTPNADAATSVASVSDGVLAGGESMVLNLQVLVTGIPQGQNSLGFTIVQVPTPSARIIPEPNSVVLLGIGGLVSLLTGRARRRAPRCSPLAVAA